ncbi:MAG: hypothetical protein ACK515_05105, partial [bacterium]
MRLSVDEAALRAALDPAGYTGRSADLARQMAMAARAAAAGRAGDAISTAPGAPRCPPINPAVPP